MNFREPKNVEAFKKLMRFKKKELCVMIELKCHDVNKLERDMKYWISVMEERNIAYEKLIKEYDELLKYKNELKMKVNNVVL
jgi:hypothetical protein